ncbi:MAG: hypothetical protein GX473_05265 [Candidatus Fermentibacter daniensis]|nr:hypothetical protein [Candidatus Fermentibacter daniensis]
MSHAAVPKGSVIADTGIRRSFHAAAPLLSAAFAAILVLSIWTRFTASSLIDDSFMFTRYADTVLSEGRFAPNPGGEPAWGLTSPAFLSVIIPLRILLPGDPVLPLLLAGTVCGLAFLALLTRLLLKAAGRDPTARRAALFLILFSAAFASHDIAFHFTSGMDTMFAMAWLTLYIGAFLARRPRAVLLGLLGGAAFVVRPDHLVFTLGTPAVVILCSSGRERRGALRPDGRSGGRIFPRPRDQQIQQQLRGPGGDSGSFPLIPFFDTNG